MRRHREMEGEGIEISEAFAPWHSNRKLSSKNLAGGQKRIAQTTYFVLLYGSSFHSILETTAHSCA